MTPPTKHTPFDDPNVVMHPLLLTTRQVAELCGVCERTINNWVRLRGFPVIRVGGAVRFDPVSVRGWLRRHESGEVSP